MRREKEEKKRSRRVKEEKETDKGKIKILKT
jgi:hypothetical protein